MRRQFYDKLLELMKSFFPSLLLKLIHDWIEMIGWIDKWNTAVWTVPVGTLK